MTDTVMKTLAGEMAAMMAKHGAKLRYRPDNCPHCEYDRRFPGFETGGWMQMDNNGPIVSCPVCNPKSEHPRS